MTNKTPSISRDEIQGILESLNRQNTRRNSPQYKVTANIMDRIQNAAAKYQGGLKAEQFISNRPQCQRRLEKLQKSASSLLRQIKKSAEDMALLRQADFTRGLTEHLTHLIEHANFNLNDGKPEGIDDFLKSIGLDRKNPPGAKAKLAYYTFIHDLADIYETATGKKPGKPYCKDKKMQIYGGPFFEFVSKALIMVDGKAPKDPTLKNSINIVLDSIK